MACTTILVGKNASFDGSTLVARNEDSPAGLYSPKQILVMEAKDQPRKYKSVLSHLEFDLPENPYRYTYCPNSDRKEGIWGAFGVNEKNVSMTATETITSNERVLGADPLVVYKKGTDKEKEVIGGLGEEDFVTVTLAYISTARQGVERLGKLLETYGTYEMNGIAFQDENEIWWFETIGGHNWMARRVKDDSYVIMPNQLGIDYFDFADAYGKKENFMCSQSLKYLVDKYDLDLRMDKNQDFNPRLAFGSHDDSDHTYNTPRAWVLLKKFNPTFMREHSELGPESDNLPFEMVAERKITVTDIKWALSNHYQETPYDPYIKGNVEKSKKYRPIGINRTNVLGLVQIRSNLPDELKSIEWFSYSSNVFNAMVPLYINVNTIPKYYASSETKVTTDSFYWVNRLIAAICDKNYMDTSNACERYQNLIANKAMEHINNTDKKFKEEKPKDIEEFFQAANQNFADFVEETSRDFLDKVLWIGSNNMTNSFSRSDA